MHSPLACVQLKAVEIMRNLMEAHDMDPRLLNDKTSRSRIAYLYMPMLNLILHFLPFMIATLPLKSNATRVSLLGGGDDLSLNGSSNLTDTFADNFDAFLAEMNLNDERRLDECCWHLSDLMGGTGDCFDIIDDYYFDDYDLNFLVDGQSGRLDDADLMFSLYPMFDNFKLEDDLAESNEDILGYINSDIDQPPLSKTSQKKRNTNVINLKKSSQQQASQLQQQQQLLQQQQQLSNQKEKSAESNIFAFLSRKHCACANLVYNKSGLKANRNIDSITNLYALKTSQDMLISAMWILKNMDKRVLFHLWQNWSYNKLNKILILIDLSVSQFEYRSTVWSCSIAAAAAAMAATNEAAAMSATDSGKSKSSSSSSKSKQLELSMANGSGSASNSKLKNKIEDLIIGSTQNVRNEIQRRNKYFSYTSLNPSGDDESKNGGSSGGDVMSMADVAKQAMFKWRRDVTCRPHHHLDVDVSNSLDSMKLVLEGNFT